MLASSSPDRLPLAHRAKRQHRDNGSARGCRYAPDQARSTIDHGAVPCALKVRECVPDERAACPGDHDGQNGEYLGLTGRPTGLGLASDYFR